MNALDFFAAKLAFQTDVSDVHAAENDFVLVDTRDLASWRQAHIPQAIHLPRRMIPMRAAALLPDKARPVVVHCWGPGCDGATKAAHELARRGYQVREMIGGIEYWIREGFPVLTAEGPVTRPADPLTAPLAATPGGSV